MINGYPTIPGIAPRFWTWQKKRQSWRRGRTPDAASWYGVTRFIPDLYDYTFPSVAIVLVYTGCIDKHIIIHCVVLSVDFPKPLYCEIYHMKADILLHIPMKYGADWYSQNLQHNYCDVSLSDIPYYIKLKVTNMVYLVFLKFVICLHQDNKMLGKLYLCSYRAT